MERTLTVPDLSCNHCVTALAGALGELPGVARVDVDLATHQITAEHDGLVTDAQPRGGIAEAGDDDAA